MSILLPEFFIILLDVILPWMAFELVILSCLLAISQSAHIPHLGTPFSARIVGGHDAKVGQFPHQVSLQRGLPPHIPLNHFCGGVIINTNWVLTAGHCVRAVAGYGTFAVKAGKHNINKDEANEQVVVVEKSYVHEDYIGNVAPFDIALLKLKSPIKFNKYVQPIDLSEAGADTEGTVTLSGWGSISTTLFPKYPDILKTVDLVTVDLKVCNASIKALSGPSEVSPLHETNLCTGPLTGGYSACSGDSGGPLIANHNSKNQVIGVVSWGILPCGTDGAPSVFVKVSSFIDWIEKTINNSL